MNTEWTRRRALRALGLGGLAVGASATLPGRAVAAAAGAAGTKPGDALERLDLVMRKIPSSGKTLPVVGLGSARTFDVPVDDAAKLAPLKTVLHDFVALGGRVVDTSPMYGTAESVIGKLAAALGVTDDLFLATKVWTRGREEGIEQMETSMKRLGSKHIDLMQVHNLVDVKTHLKTLRKWKDEGRISYIGITHYVTSAFDDLEKLIRTEPLDFVQLNYSVVTPDAGEKLLPLAREKGVAVLVNKPFENAGFFRRVRGHALPDWAKEFGAETWAQFALKFVVSDPAVTAAIPATSSPAHLRDNMRAGVAPLPAPEMRARMVKHVRGL